MKSVLNTQCNVANACTRQQCDAGRADRVAMRWLHQQQEPVEITFQGLEVESNRFANALTGLGLKSGDVCFTYLPRMPEQFFAFLGALKMELITGTLFSNFGEEALLDRLGDAGAKVVVTKKSLVKKVKRVRDRLPELRFMIVVDGESDAAAGIIGFRDLMQGASSDYKVPETVADTPSVLHYTSGSTGRPKGVLHVHGSLATQQATARDVLGLREDDIYWCTADQGWVTGTSYGILAPWSLGVTQVHYGGGYDAEAWFSVLEQERVTVWYTAPTALRMLMREDAALFSRFDLSRLRHICSVGEPLNPEVMRWAKETLGKDIYDTWFQTETGAIMIANRPGLTTRPGSMGQPVRGIEAAIIDDAGTLRPPGEQGHLCLKAGWPSMFRAYLNNDEVYRQKFRDGWYYSGDTACRDEDGYFWFKGRSDDVINTAGHLISPFEVESALLELEEIAESGVIGAPDELLFEKVIAFIHPHDEISYDRGLELKIRLYVSNKVSSIATPQEIIITDSIPKNKSGKIMRRVLKARYLGIDAGDTSTLEI